MYTEYIFSNKDYDVALKNIKALLFDIVMREESNISSLRDKAFSGSNFNSRQKLQDLFVRQDGCLRTILSLSEQLNDALKEVDSCSRELNEIEESEKELIVASVNDGTATMPVKVTAPVFTSDEPQEVVNTEESFEDIPQMDVISGSPVAVEEEVEPPVMESVSDVIETSPEENSPQEEAVVEEEKPTIVVDESANEDLLMTYDEELDEESNDKIEDTVVDDDLMTYDEKDDESTSSEEKPVLTPVISTDTIEVNNEEPSLTIEPIEENGEATLTVDNSEKTIYKKKTDLDPKVIMVSNKQFGKLVESIDKQESLLKGKSFFS